MSEPNIQLMERLFPSPRRHMVAAAAGGGGNTGGSNKVMKIRKLGLAGSGHSIFSL